MYARFKINTPSRRRPAHAGIKSKTLSGDAFTILAGFFCTFIVHLVGDIPVAEVILTLLFPILLITRGSRLAKRGLRPIYVLMALWLLSQVVTDVYRGTNTVDWARGDAAILFFGMDLACLAILLATNERRKVIFFAALATGSIVTARFFPLPIFAEDPWKFSYATGTDMMVALISCLFFWRRNYVAIVLLFGSLIVVNLYFDFRSQVLVLLLTLVAVVPVIPERIGRFRILPPAGSNRRMIVLVLLAVVASGAALGMVKMLNAAGVFGEDARQKNEMQSRAKGGLLVGGRPEFLVSSRAALASPILGYGSWAKDYRYVDMLDDVLIEYGMKMDPEEDEETSHGLIPTHSHLMGSWVWAGVLGAVFWAYILWLVLKGIVRVANLRPPLAPFYMFMLIGLTWDILFSPFGSTRRITEGATIVILLDLLVPTVLRIQSFRRFGQPKWRRNAPIGRPVRPQRIERLRPSDPSLIPPGSMNA